MSTSWKSILIAGVAGGIVLNLIDTPWSVLVMVPRMQPFMAQHSLQSHMLTGPWFLMTHIAFTTGIAWLYGLLRERYGKGVKSAIAAGMVLLVLNRLFGFGNVLMGTIPAEIYFGFSISFLVGTLVASIVIGKLVDKFS